MELDMNWESRLKSAKTKSFTFDDRKAASLWTTCAVSELKAEWKDGDKKLGPTDLYLILDGISFMTAVERNDYPTAIACFESLRKREKFLVEKS
jgi:hypothetical protein